MPRETIKVGVLAQSRPPVSRWGERILRPLALLPLVPATAPGTLLSDEDGIETWYLGPHELVLHSGDTAYYRDNLAAARPAVWVALQDAQSPARARVHMVTADPYEGEGLASDTALLVEAVPIPDALRSALASFVAQHHVELEFKKRKRKPVDLTTDPRAPRILHPQDKWERK
ncbi:DUF3305 domain-containing protein [Plastorhodobacter daqingensis]|uniref:DUF3305 domain-containing protein n=1 Tax=Plastorhodobacter daqingensis TaxID=1387281 RepID=A0ABW2UQV8_9RHOB